MGLFDRDLLPQAAATAAAAMDQANAALAAMEDDYRAAVAAIRRYNGSRAAYLAAHQAGLDAASHTADVAAGIVAAHEADPVPPEIPDPDPSQPPAVALELAARPARRAA